MSRSVAKLAPPAEAHPDLPAFEGRLREAGQFVTLQRRAIVQYLLSHREHPTAAQVAAAVTSHGASLATVYNTLARLQELGLLLAVRSPEGEIHWDVRTDAHHHLTCSACGAVSDVEQESAEITLRDPELKQRVERVALWLVGRCPRCA